MRDRGRRRCWPSCSASLVYVAADAAHDRRDRCSPRCSPPSRSASCCAARWCWCSARRRSTRCTCSAGATSSMPGRRPARKISAAGLTLVAGHRRRSIAACSCSCAARAGASACAPPARIRCSPRSAGIGLHGIYALAWGLATFTGGMAGMLIALRLGARPGRMVTIGLKAFPAALVGGLDSLLGALVGSLIVAAAEVLLIHYVEPAALRTWCRSSCCSRRWSCARGGSAAPAKSSTGYERAARQRVLPHQLRARPDAARHARAARWRARSSCSWRWPCPSSTRPSCSISRNQVLLAVDRRGGPDAAHRLSPARSRSAMPGSARRRRLHHRHPVQARSTRRSG